MQVNRSVIICLYTGCLKKMRQIFSIISPSILLLQCGALYVQKADVLPFVLHIGMGLSDKWFPRLEIRLYTPHVPHFALTGAHTCQGTIILKPC